MRQREQRIAELIETVAEKSKGFTNPPIVVIGGYALRAHVPFSRFSRDWDFAMPQQKNWAIDKIEKWFPALSAQTKEKHGSYGFLRLIKIISGAGNKIKVSLDFMEGEVRGRKGDSVLIDEDFIAQSVQTTIHVGDLAIPVKVPSYEDYFILKLMSSRPSDIRDIVALVAAKGIPDETRLRKRIAGIVNKPEQLSENLELVFKDLSDPRFVDSWRGTFVTEAFAEADKKRVRKELEALRKVKRA